MRWPGAWLALAVLTAAGQAAPRQVTIHSPAPGRFELRCDGAPFFVRGAGGHDHLARLAAAGANSVRTWGSDQTALVLDEAQRLGLTVCAGLWIEHERHGFNYEDPAAVRAQVEAHCRAVDRFKDHPALLLWSVGNEVETAGGNPAVWDAIESVAAYIKRVDPHHPVMTVTAHVSPTAVAAIKQRCPSIDLLGCNCYAGITVIAADVRKAGWSKPYLVTEWGNNGYWEVGRTQWGAELEPTSAEKADQRAERYRSITGDPERCLGSYAFFWGQKQEITPTWFNLFTPDGAETESVAVLESLWTGRPAAHVAPRISALRLNGVAATENLQVRAGAQIRAEFDLLPGSANVVEVRWELLPESPRKSVGGDPEARLAALPLPQSADSAAERTTLSYAAPTTPGPYRLFVIARGAHHAVATANFPFLVVAP